MQMQASSFITFFNSSEYLLYLESTIECELVSIHYPLLHNDLEQHILISSKLLCVKNLETT